MNVVCKEEDSFRQYSRQIYNTENTDASYWLYVAEPNW